MIVSRTEAKREKGKTEGLKSDDNPSSIEIRNMIIRPQGMKAGEVAKCMRAKCGKEWMLRKDGLPVQCPRCKSTVWWRDEVGVKEVAGRTEGSEKKEEAAEGGVMYLKDFDFGS